MSAELACALALLRAALAERLQEPGLDWLDDERPLLAQGVGSLDLIAALAHLQREAGLGLSEHFPIDAETSLLAVAAALRVTGGKETPWRLSGKQSLHS
jgi:aryl carrier-like protein